MNTGKLAANLLASFSLVASGMWVHATDGEVPTEPTLKFGGVTSYSDEKAREDRRTSGPLLEFRTKGTWMDVQVLQQDIGNPDAGPVKSTMLNVYGGLASLTCYEANLTAVGMLLPSNMRPDAYRGMSEAWLKTTGQGLNKVVEENCPGDLGDPGDGTVHHILIPILRR